jgi:glucose/arabinose dehydrogenase
MRATLVTIAAVLLVSCGPAGDARKAQSQKGAPPTQSVAAIEVETLAEGLQNPWSIAFLPGGDILASERPGRLRLIEDGWRAEGAALAAPRLVEKPVAGVPEVFVKSQAGLFDIVPSPRFAEDQTLFISHAAGDAGANRTRLVKAHFDGAALSGLETIFEATPDKKAAAHYGARMAFMNDGSLLMTIGDGFDYREQAQSLENTFGKIVRLGADGAPPADNPFAGRKDAHAAIYTLGHRNAQGLAIDPASGVVYATEHGPLGGDELNIILPGMNYGWPLASFGLDYSGAQVTPYTELPGKTSPIAHWTPSIAPSGLAVYRGAMFPEWEGDILMGAMSDADEARQGLYRLDMAAGKVVAEEIYLKGERVRDVRVGPDGAIYVATEDHDGAAVGRILRLTPKRG